MNEIYALQYQKLFEKLRRTLWQDLSRCFPSCHEIYNAFLSRQSAYQTVCSHNGFHHDFDDLLKLYHSYFLLEFQEIDDLDVHRRDCRNDAKPLSHLVILQNIKSMIFGVAYIFSFQSRIAHTPLMYTQPSIPSTVFHHRKSWIFLYPRFPRIYQCISVLQYSYQCASIALGQAPNVSSVAGDLHSHNYIMV